MEWCGRFPDIKRIVEDLQGECGEGECDDDNYVKAVAGIWISSWLLGNDVQLYHLSPDYLSPSWRK